MLFGEWLGLGVIPGIAPGTNSIQHSKSQEAQPAMSNRTVMVEFADMGVKRVNDPPTIGMFHFHLHDASLRAQAGRSMASGSRRSG